MSAIIEHKWDINYIEPLTAQIQQKVLRKILEKVFITQKCTQCKILHAIKIDFFELSDNINIGKLLPKYELFCMCQANSSSDLFQISIL